MGRRGAEASPKETALKLPLDKLTPLLKTGLATVTKFTPKDLLVVVHAPAMAVAEVTVGEKP